jgi:predicted nucleic acid-binding protein
VKLLDTSVCADHLLGRPRAVALLDELLDAGEELVASELVRFELLAGTRPAERAALDAFQAAVTWVPVTEPVARLAADLAHRHRTSGASTDATDYLLAATAMVIGAELVTLDADHFPMFPGLAAPY